MRGVNHFLSRYLNSMRVRKSNFNWRILPGPNDTIHLCGSMPISHQQKGRKWDSAFISKSYLVNKEIIEKRQAFTGFVKLCETQNIKLFIVSPPNYYKPNLKFESRIQHLVFSQPKRNVIYYLYNQNNPIYSNPAYYYDESHLKINGARIFTSEIGHFITPFISLKSNQNHRGSAFH